MFSSRCPGLWIPFILVSACARELTAAACDLAVIYFIPKAYYSEVWTWSVCMRLRACVWNSTGETEPEFMCLYWTGPQTTCVYRGRAPTVSWRVLVGKFREGKRYFLLKHQYPHAELIKSTLARQETSNKTQHMETVRLLWFRSRIWALQWI